jgi:intraflagellar transport protein 172
MHERGTAGDFEILLMIAHYYAMRSVCRSNKSLEKIASKISVAMLRHSDVIPADKAFYEAGIDCKVSIN